MRFTDTELAGCVIVDIEPISDERGFFARRTCAREFADHGLPDRFVQSSLSSNPVAGTLRGLHFERPPHFEEKLVTCPHGAMFDVAVDLRQDSPTYARWVGVELTAANHRMLYLPKGFAHGFVTLLADTVVGYQMAQFYEPGRSAGIVWNDPDIGIKWPSTPTLIGELDRNLPFLRDIDCNTFETLSGRG